MNRRAKGHAAMVSLSALGILSAVWAGAQTAERELPPKTGVQTAGVQHAMDGLTPIATFVVKGDPDWMAVTPNAIWVVSSNVNHVVRLDARTNQPGTIVSVAEPCSGLAVGFGSLWIPSCGEQKLVRVDAETGALQATIAAGPADDEGGIAVGAGSIWMVTSKDGDLARIDPGTNKVIAHIRLPVGSFNPAFLKGSLWVTSNTGGTLVRVEPTTNKGRERNSGGIEAAVPHSGRRFHLGSEPGRRHCCPGECIDRQPNRFDRCGNSGAGRRDYFWRRCGVG
jgi:streptogramin lyase